MTNVASNPDQIVGEPENGLNCFAAVFSSISARTSAKDPIVEPEAVNPSHGRQGEMRHADGAPSVSPWRTRPGSDKLAPMARTPRARENPAPASDNPHDEAEARAPGQRAGVGRVAEGSEPNRQELANGRLFRGAIAAGTVASASATGSLESGFFAAASWA